MRVVAWFTIAAVAWACSAGEPSPRVERSKVEAAVEPAGEATPEADPGPGPKIPANDVPPPEDPPGAKSSQARAEAGSDPDSPHGSAEPLPATAVELRAADGTVVHGVLYGVQSKRPRPIVLLFHQAASNAAEYEPIAPRLQALGYHALAIDQRSGKRRFGRDNLTVLARGRSTTFGPAYRDLQAALRWAEDEAYPAVIAWGSSYSAALVFRLAAEHPEQLAAVLAFSPGEYMGVEGKVAGWAQQVRVPVFVTSAPGKEARQAKALVEAVGEGAEQHVPSRGVHGSSTLHPSRNPSGHREVWTAVEAFLARVVP